MYVAATWNDCVCTHKRKTKKLVYFFCIENIDKYLYIQAVQFNLFEHFIKALAITFKIVTNQMLN